DSPTAPQSASALEIRPRRRPRRSSSAADATAAVKAPCNPNSAARMPSAAASEPTRRWLPARPNERLVPLYSPAHRALSACHRRDAGRLARLFLAAGLVAAAGRLPDDPGPDATPGRKPGRDSVAGHGAARTSVRPDPGNDSDDLVVILRHQPDHPAV